MMMSSRGRWGAEEVKQILSRICTPYVRSIIVKKFIISVVLYGMYGVRTQTAYKSFPRRQLELPGRDIESFLHLLPLQSAVLLF